MIAELRAKEVREALISIGEPLRVKEEILDGIAVGDFDAYLALKSAPRLVRRKMKIDEEMMKELELRAREARSPTTSARLEVVRSAASSFDGNVSLALEALSRAATSTGRRTVSA